MPRLMNDRSIVPQRVDKYQMNICVSDIIQMNEETDKASMHGNIND